MSVRHNVSDGTQPDTENPHSDSKPRRRGGDPVPPPHTGGALTRVTANFTPRAMASLERVSDKTGDSRTDVLNRAVMAYETVLDLIAEGDGRTLRIKLPNGEERVLQFIG
jgi:hypothetical protein